MTDLRNSLVPFEMATFLRQYCGVKVRDWQTDEDWQRENATLKEIIRYLEEEL